MCVTSDFASWKSHFCPTVQRERGTERSRRHTVCSSRTSLAESCERTCPSSPRHTTYCENRFFFLSPMRDQPLASISAVLLALHPDVRARRSPFLAAGASFCSTTAPFRVSLLAVLFQFLLLSTICRDNQGSIVTFCEARLFSLPKTSCLVACTSSQELRPSH